MPRPRFSETLFQRRRELGLSISQASKVLKLKESVLIAFEEGDFSAIPKSGYAQGMLSGYARYLGLNPREIVDLFSEDLYEHSHGQASHELRRRTRQTRSGSPLPSGRTGRLSASDPATTDDTHAFDTTSEAVSRSQSWARPTPLASSRRPYSYAASDQSSGAGRQDQAYARDPRYGREPSRQERPYTTRVPEAGTRSYRSTRPQTRRSQQGPYAPEIEDRRGRAGYRSGDVTSRRVSSQQYVDDLRLDDELTSSYEPASTHIGRRGSRNIASTERPNVQRSSSGAGRRQLRDRRRQEPRHGGVLGFLENWFSDSRRAMVTVLVVLAVVLMLVIVSSVRSCVAAHTDTSKRIAVTEVASSEAATTAAEPETVEAATTAAEPETEPVTETNVTVSIADGDVSWLEIDCDGTSEVADTLTGPWEKTYTVTQSITIQAGDPTAVKVTKNGESVAFTSKASGVGSVTIEGTQVQATTEATTADADAASATS